MSLLLKFNLPCRLIRNYSLANLNPQQPETVKGIWTRKILNDQELTLNAVLNNDNIKKINNDKWLKIRDELIKSKHVQISEKNVDAVILDTCKDLSKDEIALNYVKYLIDSNYKLNIAVIGKYFRFLNDHNLSDIEKKKIIELYDDLRSNHKLLDAFTAESCIIALSKTKRWKECFELMDMVKLSMNPRTVIGSSISAAAFDNNEENIGWEYLKNMLPNLWPDEKPYISYLNYCIRTTDKNNTIELENKIIKMFEFWKYYDIHPWVDILDKYYEAINQTWIGSVANVKSTGECQNCGHTLDHLQLTQEQFDSLSQAVLDKVLLGDNIYYTTTPKEFIEFKYFIEKTRPYDVVIDGLNAAYSLRQSKDYRALGGEATKVVKLFKDQNKKVLVLGRKHMNKWKGPAMSYVQKNALMFLTNDLSEDDPYLLYATLKSGIDTYFSSKDLMRQHKYSVNDPNLRKLFKMWQVTRQVVPKYYGTVNKSLFLKYPPSYVPIAQSTDTHWHIPCILNKAYGNPIINDNEAPKQWYCLKKKQL
ncbi:hypothetical protein HCN44_004614 [Aphidius gifuensis]|uniref:Mitochondrial ribonuclease P catalytic subunit n=1 Tax=Aphidius gifuensis TaxID=684658 RepID=A0A834XZE6_APHGI|nr:hypothetical protein HCN44_004614 [Aphidius gifuensis]